MHSLRNTRTLARLVLVWFALAVGVAVASPHVKPQGLVLVCSSAGVLKVLPASDDQAASAGLLHAFDCPLCVATAAPLPYGPAGATSQAPQAFVAGPAPLPHGFFRPAAPLPARGPPLGS
jgi:hypothetical protein